MDLRSVLRRGHFGLGLMIALLVSFAAVSHSYWGSEPSFSYVCILFFLPLLHFGASAGRLVKSSSLRPIFLWTIGLCSVAHLVMWGIYIRSLESAVTSGLLSLASYACIFLSAILTLVCFVITGWTMSKQGNIPDTTSFAGKVARQVKSYPFLSLNFFVASFLYLSFFLTFSLAFNDRGPGRAIYAEDLTASNAKEKSSPLHVEDFSGYLFFQEGSADIELDERYLDPGALDEALVEHSDENDRSQIRRKFRNAQTMNQILKAINDLDKDIYFEIVLCGHANERELSEAAQKKYGHNRWLAQDRADWVEEFIESKLDSERWDKVTFRKRPGSTSNQYVIPVKKIPTGFDPKLLVEVVIRPQQDHVGTKISESLEDKQKNWSCSTTCIF
jgi:hypothetical protein